jgi:uncharacterized repeat protein (TIGR03803 family)
MNTNLCKSIVCVGLLLCGWQLRATAGETVLHSFVPNAQGSDPQANLYIGLDGKFYGTTFSGGTGGGGVVFKTDGHGHETVLYNFTGGADGSGSFAGVIQDWAGNLYGTTANGGTGGAGVVFKVDPRGRETVLHSFTGGADGGYSYAGLVQDWAGSLYGTASIGGSGGAGVVFKIDQRGRETVLFNFTGGADGGYPYGPLIQDFAGNLYGAASGGGPAGVGLIFKLDPHGHETVLYNFTGGADGAYPNAVIQDLLGNLYGTTSGGGGAAGAGVVFKLDRRGRETTLYSFTGGSDGGYPYAVVVEDWAGNLYGTASSGGATNQGVVFKVDQRGNETVLHSFAGGADGAYPYGSLIIDFAGNLYGDASYAGTANAGVVFKVDQRGNETVTYTFPGTDGSNPVGGVIQDASGNFYGTTAGGGPVNQGVIFKVDTAGHETLLYTFTGGADGGDPNAGLVQDSSGNFYGTAVAGGAAGTGVVFKLDASGHYSVVYNFTGGADGGYPYSNLLMDAAGNMYGTTYGGGASGKGTIYELDPSGHETVLHSFTGPDGSNPYAGVVRDAAGNFYGTASQGGTRGGVTFKMDPAGNYTVLQYFDYGSDGGFPWGGVTLDSAGNVYGTTWSGGSPSGDYPGVVYEVNSSGTFSVLYSFTGFADGGGSRSNVVFDSAGNLYGTTQYGGQGPCPYFGCGVLFQLSPSGQQTVVHDFTGGADGAEPGVILLRDAAGNFYGTTGAGGTAGGGVVYKLTPGGDDSPEITTPVQKSFAPAGRRHDHPMPGEPPRDRKNLSNNNANTIKE